jgi:hypothetical protein
VYTSAIFRLISFLILVPTSPISPTIRVFDMVATLSSLMTDASLNPVCLNSECFSLMVMSVTFGFSVLEDMKATTTSFSS